MPFKKYASRSSIAIDFDYNEFRAVQLEAALPVVIANFPRTGRHDLIPSPDETKTLQRHLTQRGFTGTDTILSLPKESSSFHILDLPPIDSGAPIDHLAKLQIQQAATHNTSDIEIDLWTLPINDSRKTSQSYTVASETKPLHQLIDAFESANLNPIRIEPIETALARSAAIYHNIDESAINAIVEIGWDHSWCVITLGAIPVYTRRVDYGIVKIHRQLIDDHAMPIQAIPTLLSGNTNQELPHSLDRVMTSLLTPMLASLVQQLDTALTYVAQQHRAAPFGTIFRSGYFANHSHTAQAITNRTGMPSEHLMLPLSTDLETDPFSSFEIEHSPRLNIAAGLALGDVA